VAAQDIPLRWAIIGMGRAGMARCRAIKADPRSELVAVYRGKNAERAGVPVVATFDEAVNAADALAISSPSALHPEQVRAALEARKHVVCEYPLAPNAATAKSLLDRAAVLSRVLHVEHIELLHAPQVVLRSHTRHDPVTKLRQEAALQGPDDIAPADLARRHLSRLHRVIHLAGEVEDIESVEARPGKVKITTNHVGGARVRMVWEQSPYLQRFTKMRCRTASGQDWRLEGDALYAGRAPQTLIESRSLFSQDHDHAMARILNGAAGYVSAEQLMRVLQTLDRIASAC
jgi:hypothetical protein